MIPNKYLNQLKNWGQSQLAACPFLKKDSTYLQKLSSSPYSLDYALLVNTLQHRHDEKLVLLRNSDWQSKPDLLSEVLELLCLYKYAHNLAYLSLQRLYRTGSVLYNPEKLTARVIVGNDGREIRVRKLREKPVQVRGERIRLDEISFLSYQQAARYIPLANVTELDYKHSSLTYLDEYLELFAGTLTNYRALTQFQKRMVVVAPQHVARSYAHILPIRYQFTERLYKVPVETPLIEVVNRYADARQAIRQDDSLEEVIIIGDVGYRESLTDLLNDLGDGYFQRAIILGNAPLSADYGCCTWAWSTGERIWLRTGQQPSLNTVLLPSCHLKSLRSSFEEPLLQLMITGVPEQQARAALNRLIGQYLRDAIIDVPNLLAYHQELLEDPQSVWAYWFIESGNEADYATFCQSLLQCLRLVADRVANQPEKLQRISQLAHPGCKTYVVARPKQAAVLNSYFASTSQIRAISYRDLKRLLEDPIIEPEQFIFPALHLSYQPGGQLLRDYHLYQRALERGPGYVLQYEGLEDGLNGLCAWLFSREEHRALTHTDRQHWVNFTCEIEPALNGPVTWNSGLLANISPREVADIDTLLNELEALDDTTPEQQVKASKLLQKLNQSFTNYFGVWKDIDKHRRKSLNRQHPREIPFGSVTTPTVDRQLTVHFGSHQLQDCKPQTLLARKKTGGGIEAIRADQVKKGDILAYFSINFEDCREALLTIPEASDALKEVRWASKTWRRWLIESIDKLAVSKAIPREAAKRLRYEKLREYTRSIDPTDQFVAPETMESWIKGEGDRKDDYSFPRTILHLEAVLANRLKQVLPADLPAKEKEKERIMLARDQSASFREVVTRLNHELANFLTTEQKGPMLAKLSSNHLESLLKTNQFIVVSQIALS